MARPVPFEITIPAGELDLLQKRLALTVLPDELDEAGWDYGAPLSDIKSLITYWRESFDWRKHEAHINKTLPQFTIAIPVDGFETLEIHFVHKTSEKTNAIPLLFAHGWPGQFLEVSKMLPALTSSDGSGPSFHVIAPSLPNFGFSEGTKKRGFGPRQYAEVCHKLMQALGYDQYVTQGGDWGYMVTRLMGSMYPESCKASHINMALPKAPSYDQPLLAFQFFARYFTSGLTEEEKGGAERGMWFQKEGNGYMKLQGTKPQTIGYSLASSPVGLLAFIYEKLHDWTDNYPWTPDEILTWISIYVFSRAGPAAASRIYYEVAHDKEGLDGVARWVPHVKLGIARFPQEIARMPKSWNQTMGEVVLESEYAHGGHFAAWEVPEAVVGDLKTMCGKGGGAYGVVKGKDGFSS